MPEYDCVITLNVEEGLFRVVHDRIRNAVYQTPAIKGCVREIEQVMDERRIIVHYTSNDGDEAVPGLLDRALGRVNQLGPTKFKIDVVSSSTGISREYLTPGDRTKLARAEEEIRTYSDLAEEESRRAEGSEKALADARRQLEETRERGDRLEIEVANKDAQISGLRLEGGRYETNYRAAQRRIADLEQNILDRDLAHRTEIDGLRSEQDDAITRLRGVIDNKEKDAATQRRDKARLESDKRDLANKLRNMEEQRGKHLRRIDELGAQLASGTDVQQKLAEAEAKLHKYERDLADVRRENEEITKALELSREYIEGAEAVENAVRNDPEAVFRYHMWSYSPLVAELHDVVQGLVEVKGIKGDDLDLALSLSEKTFVDFVKETVTLPEEISRILVTDEDIDKFVQEAGDAGKNQEYEGLRKASDEADKRLGFISRYEAVRDAGKDAILAACGEFADDLYRAFINSREKYQADKDAFGKARATAEVARVFAEQTPSLRESYIRLRNCIRDTKDRIRAYAEERGLKPEEVRIPYFVRTEERGDSFVLRIITPLDESKKDGFIRDQLDEHILLPFGNIDQPGVANGAIRLQPTSSVIDNLLAREIVLRKPDFDVKTAKELRDRAIGLWFEEKEECDLYKLGIGLEVITLDSRIG